MPPRLTLFPCLKAPQWQPIPIPSRSFTTTSSTLSSKAPTRKRHRDAYAIQQAKARKAANISRQVALRKERAAALGDPVRGITTPYIQSFDTGTPTERLNFFLSESEVAKGLEHSQYLATPLPNAEQTPTDLESLLAKPREQEGILTPILSSIDQTADEADSASPEADHATAAEALRRIASLSLGSSKDRQRANIQNCIDTFGRHQTDTTLPSRPQAAPAPASTPSLPKTPRIGRDTGSSEVQIAILTSKIRSLANFLESPRGRMDKANKRNLRLLVHRRAKLCKYLRRKERGGPRWSHLVETLGLTEGTWKGEIRIVGPLGGHSPVRLRKLLARDDFKDAIVS